MVKQICLAMEEMAMAEAEEMTLVLATEILGVRELAHLLQVVAEVKGANLKFHLSTIGVLTLWHC